MPHVGDPFRPLVLDYAARATPPATQVERWRRKAAARAHQPSTLPARPLRERLSAGALGRA